MKYVMYNISKFKESIECDNLNNKCKKREKDFSRNRKLTPKDLILFTLNNRGKTTKMELYDFTQEYNIDEVIFEDIQLQDNIGNNVATFKTLAEVMGVIIELLTELNIP